MAQGPNGSRLHAFVSQNILSSTCHVSFLAAPDTDHQHKLSHLPLQFCGRSLAHSRACCLTILFMYLATIQGGVADPPKSHLPQNKETWDNLFATRDNRNKSSDMSRGTNMKHLRTPETAVQAPIQRLPSRRSKNRHSRSQSMLCAIR